jgi:hypothetical protein
MLYTTPKGGENMDKLEPYGYLIDSGYIGRIENESKREFSTEDEYLDYISDYNSLATSE